MAHLGHPVAGDPVYKRAKDSLGLEGQAACGQAGIQSPGRRGVRGVSAGVPDDFRNALSMLQERYALTGRDKEELHKWLDSG